MSIFKSANLRSKIIAAMMAAAALTGLTQAWLGYQNIRDSFSSSLGRQLTSVANITARDVESYLDNARSLTRSLSNDATVSSALAELNDGVRLLQTESFPAQMRAKLVGFYDSNYVPALKKVTGSSLLVDALIPTSSAASYLQYHYIAANPHTADTRMELVQAPDGSAYSTAHGRFHKQLRALRDEFGFADVFLINPQGQVIYTTLKEVDFMADLDEGPFNDSGLANVFRSARRDRAARAVAMQDYSLYLPSLGAPSFFMATSVFEQGQFLGVIAVQLYADPLNNIVTNGRNWSGAGLGDTGDMFIVDNAGLLRTNVRPYLLDAKGFAQRLRETRTPSTVIQSVEAFGTLISLVSADGRLAEGADHADTTVREVTNFFGAPASAVVVPLSIAGLDWNLVAEISAEEAQQPLRDFQKLMMLALALTVTLTTIGAMYFAGLFTRPLRLLSSRLTKAAQGDLHSPVALSQSDEFGEVSRAAQSLLDSLKLRLGSADKARLDSEDLLSRFLPEIIVRVITSRKQQGDDTLDDIAQEIPNATYVLGRLSGYEGIFASLSPKGAVQALDELVEVVDLAAEKHGVEKVRTAGDSYFAMSGLSTPHIDHRQRGLAFAQELREIVERFANSNGSGLQVRIGITSGPAVSGVIGRHKLAFDVWGAPVGEVEILNAMAKPGEILVSADFATKSAEFATFEASNDPGNPGRLLLQTGDSAVAQITSTSAQA